MVKIPENLVNELHGVYLGKNRRLADPVFLPGADPRHATLNYIKESIAKEVDGGPAPSPPTIRDVMAKWGWGYFARYPPGGPEPSTSDYEANINALAADVFSKWQALHQTVSRREDRIQTWVENACRDTTAESNLKGVLQAAWKETVNDFNDCRNNPVLKKFMDPISTSSDFYLATDTTLPKDHAPDYNLLNVFFDRGDLTSGDFQYMPRYRHTEFSELRDHKDWPHPGEPERRKSDNRRTYLNDNERKFIRKHRAMFLIPHINAEDLTERFNLMTFIHYRSRLHPAVYARIDHEMTYLGRSAKRISGPVVGNRMVSFETKSLIDDTNIYTPRMWRGWGAEPENTPGAPPGHREHYRQLYYRGQLFGTSEAWLILQSQRFTYTFLRSLVSKIAGSFGLSGMIQGGLNPTVEELNELRRKAVIRIEELRVQEGAHTWQHFVRVRQYLPPPTCIMIKTYVSLLEAKIIVAEDHLTKIFDDPEYFFDTIMELMEHHWGNIKVKHSKDEMDEEAEVSAYFGDFAEDKIRHELYFDCIRRVIRRAIFEFYMWHAVNARLLEFDNIMATKFANYKNLQTDVFGCSLMWRPPGLVNILEPGHKSGDFEKYLELVILIRYFAMFFVNEFRKNGIHAASEPMRDLVTSIGLPRPPVDLKNVACHIPKGQYSAPDMDLLSKLKDGKSYSMDVKTKSHRLFLFESMDSLIAEPMDCMNAGIRRVTENLQSCMNAPGESGCAQFIASLVSDTIDGLDVLTNLADHLETLWPAMDFIGGAATEEGYRERLFGRAGDGISINILNFDAFDYDDKVPEKRLNRLFRFFDELQGFREETIHIGHARGDLKRFGASLLCKLIEPENKRHSPYQGSEDALVRLEGAMGVKRNDHVFQNNEQPMDLDQEEAAEGEVVPIVKQRHTYRGAAARARELSKQRLERRLAAIALLDGSNQDRDKILNAADQTQDITKKKKWRPGARARRRDKEKQRAAEQERAKSRSPERATALEEEGGHGDDEEDSSFNDPRWEESLHATLRQFRLPPVPETRVLPQPPAPVSNPSSSQPLPLAPDGQPKHVLPRRVWETLDSIYFARRSVTWAELLRAMAAIGYTFDLRGGTHGKYSWTRDCRWPEDALPKGNAIVLSKNHEGENKKSARGKSQNWGKRLKFQGVTIEFIKRWYSRPAE